MFTSLQVSEHLPKCEIWERVLNGTSMCGGPVLFITGSVIASKLKGHFRGDRIIFCTLCVSEWVSE